MSTTTTKNSTDKSLLYGVIGISVGVGLAIVIKNLTSKKAVGDLPKEEGLSPEVEHKEEKKQETKPEQGRGRKMVRTITKVLEQEAKDHRIEIETLYAKENSLVAELLFLDSGNARSRQIFHLAKILDVTDFPLIVSPLIGDSKYRSVFGGEGFLPVEAFVKPDSYVLGKASLGADDIIEDIPKYLRAGPRKHLFFRPDEVRACIVTCGGLCPGLNVVIREIFMSLHFNYKAPTVFGIKYGYKGFYTYPWIELTKDMVKGIHEEGGTMLGSSRGGFKLNEIMDKIIENNVNQIYIVGGDGTHKGIQELFLEISKRKLKIAICGIPKTIDNDIPIIDKSFGFETAVEEAQRAIQSAFVESHCAENGIGLVKLMGRSAGFIAMYAALAARCVNICLIPEFEFELYGPRGMLEYVHRRLKLRNSCVIVVAEGAPSAIKDYVIEAAGKDASGNVKFGDIGTVLKDEITKHCKAKGMEVTLKFIDPTYMIRTVPANAYDKQICSQLSQNAVHAMMSGWTGFTVGLVNNRTCLIPLSEVADIKIPTKVTPHDRAWQRLLASTGQPSFVNEEPTTK
jgi:6-phosphofructokinase 1